MSDPRVEEVVRQVRVELLEQLSDFQKNAPAYITDYVKTLLGPAKTTWRPRPGFHPKLAELIRDLALDAAVMDRLPSATRVNSQTRDNDRPLTTRSKYVSGTSTVVTRRGDDPHGAASPEPRNESNEDVRPARRYLEPGEASPRGVAA